MPGISTSINLNDGMTSVLHSMYTGVNHLVSGFRNMQNSVNRGFNESAFNNFKRHMSDAIAQMGVMEREAQRTSQSTKNIFDWKKQENFKIFNSDINSRFKQESGEIVRQMNSVLSAQEHVKRKALSTEFLPQRAISDIVNTDKQIKNLIASMNQLKNVDSSSLSFSQKNSLNAEYESMRKNIMALKQLQNDINFSSSKGDVSGINSSINQTKSIIEQTEVKLRSFREALNQINSFSWQSGGAEVFNTNGLARARQEINSAKRMAEGLIQTQQRLTSNASKMKMLPPNAVSDIQNINRRISGIGGTIARLEREKSKLSRWNLSGINQYNSRIESLRQKMYEAEQAQREFNSAVKANDAERLNSAYRRLAGTIDKIDIDIRDNNSAQQQFNSSLGTGSRNAASLGSNIRSMAGHLKMYAGMALGGFGVKQGIEVTDTYANLSARLGLITKSQAEAAVLQDKLYQSAQRTGTAYTDMAGTTAKLGLLAGGAFKNNAELTKFSELMSKSFKVSGASTQEQQAGMYQLTQAMASGRLQGDEFRSIIENAPMLAQAISNYMGVGMDGLKEMSREGAISAEIIKNSLFTAAQEIDKKFAEMPRTFGSYFSEIKNTAYMEFSGIMRGINSAINTDGFKSFVENVKLSIGSMAEWVTLRFYEFKNSFTGLWTLAQPALQAISSGFATVRNYVFSTNGIMGQLIRTMSKVFSSKGFANAVRSLSNVFMASAGSVMYFIQILGNLIAAFDWLGPVLIRVIAAVKIYNTVSNATQGIHRMLISTMSIFSSTVRNATTAVQAETAATNGAKAAQLGLNTAIRANPFGILASALTIVISLFADLNRQIDEVNAKTGSGGSYRTQYDAGVRKLAEKQGISITTAAQIYSNEDSKNEEIKKQEQNKKNAEKYYKAEEARKNIKAYEEEMKKGKYHGSKDEYGGYVNINGIGKVSDLTYQSWKNRVYAVDRLNSIYDKNIKDANRQYVADKWKLIFGDKKQQIEKAKMEAEWNKNEEEWKNIMSGLSAGAGGVPDKIDVGTVDKINDTVDVTSEDLKFMRDYADRSAVNRINNNTIEQQIKVEFTGQINSEMDVNAMIGKAAEILSRELYNSGEAVHI